MNEEKLDGSTEQTVGQKDRQVRVMWDDGNPPMAKAVCDVDGTNLRYRVVYDSKTGYEEWYEVERLPSEVCPYCHGRGTTGTLIQPRKKGLAIVGKIEAGRADLIRRTVVCKCLGKIGKRVPKPLVVPPRAKFDPMVAWVIAVRQLDQAVSHFNTSCAVSQGEVPLSIAEHGPFSTAPTCYVLETEGGKPLTEFPDKDRVLAVEQAVKLANDMRAIVPPEQRTSENFTKMAVAIQMAEARMRSVKPPETPPG
jgi:hypothetical protein